jgi:hypothetical protein
METPLSRWLAESKAACPYLTIEYKCASKTGKKFHAFNQNACASIIWLLQRRTMRHDLGLETADLRHYSIIFVDAQYEIWEARCEAETFPFAIMEFGDLRKVADVKELVKWSNAIHRWGLGPNATSFKADVLELLKRLDADPQLTLNSLGVDDGQTTDSQADPTAAAETGSSTVAEASGETSNAASGPAPAEPPAASSI